MSITKSLTVAAGTALVGGAITAGVGLFAAGVEPPQDPPRVVPRAVSPAQVDADDRDANEKTTNNLKQIGLAMHNFNQAQEACRPPRFAKTASHS